MRYNYWEDDFKKEKCPYCGCSIKSQQKYCMECGHLVNGWKECGKDRCGNCHELLKPDDKYCRYCGTKVGEGEFAPFQNIMQCMYGPKPVERIHTCKQCQYSWTTMSMVDYAKFCPKCGGEIITDENPNEKTGKNKRPRLWFF